MHCLPEEICVALKRMRITGVEAWAFEIRSARGGLPKDMADTISAFANCGGGTIILGLDERNGFAPVPGFDAESCAEALQWLEGDFTPACRLAVGCYLFEGAPVVVTFVDPVPLRARPCYVTRKGLREGAFLRMEDGNRSLTDYEISRMREFGGQPSHDRELVLEASMSDLDASVLDGIVRRNREIAPRIFDGMERTEVLLKLGVIAPAPDKLGMLVPTLAGLLAAGIYPQQFFPRLDIVFRVFPGVSEGEKGVGCCVLSRSVCGSIPEMIRSTLELLEKNMNRAGIIEGTLRCEVADYPLLACREALANALQHRDYSPEGRDSPVQVSLYADKLEILSPGGLFGMEALGGLPVGISSARNLRLSQLLEFTPDNEKCGAGFVIENRGTGLQKIRGALQEAQMPETEFRDFVSAFRVTFFKRRMMEDGARDRSWRKNFDAALFSELSKKGSMSVAEIIETSGLSRNTVSAHVRSLRERGLIEGTERSKSPRQRYRLVRKPSQG